MASPTATFRLSANIPAQPAAIYAAWIDGRKHTAITGQSATCDARVGGRFTAFEGTIFGTTRILEPGRRIVQTWRSSEFPDDSPDSSLEVLFEQTKAGTLVTLVHSEVPRHQSHSYEKGWKEYYFKPMKAYFTEAAVRRAKVAASAKGPNGAGAATAIAAPAKAAPRVRASRSAVQVAKAVAVAAPAARRKR